MTSLSETTEEYKNNSITSWDELTIKTELLRGIYSYGFETPSPIQQKAILPIKQGKDLIAQAQSGTGKTGAFTIGMLEYIDETIQETQAIVLSPTRELAHQIDSVINIIGKMMNKFQENCVQEFYLIYNIFN